MTSTRDPGWEGVDDTTAPMEVAEVVAAIDAAMRRERELGRLEDDSSLAPA